MSEKHPFVFTAATKHSSPRYAQWLEQHDATGCVCVFSSRGNTATIEFTAPLHNSDHSEAGRWFLRDALAVLPEKYIASGVRRYPNRIQAGGLRACLYNVPLQSAIEVALATLGNVYSDDVLAARRAASIASPPVVSGTIVPTASPRSPVWGAWTVVIKCPYCQLEHTHGAGNGTPREANGHRVAHCILRGWNDAGYVIRCGE